MAGSIPIMAAAPRDNKHQAKNTTEEIRGWWIGIAIYRQLSIYHWKKGGCQGVSHKNSIFRAFNNLIEVLQGNRMVKILDTS
jgi:hypothetical protein